MPERSQSNTYEGITRAQSCELSVGLKTDRSGKERVPRDGRKGKAKGKSERSLSCLPGRGAGAGAAGRGGGGSEGRRREQQPQQVEDGGMNSEERKAVGVRATVVEVGYGGVGSIMPRIMAQEQSSGVRRRSLESAMKEPQARTKVVLRHLPPSISQQVLLEQIHSKYAERYTWFNFHPGKSSHKRQVFSQAYINFKKSEDVFDFYEDFDGHIFVNERGTQCKASVEYAPYQRIPKPRSKKDIREGTILKDPDYLEFLEMLGKPTEFLPSAEVQLERREAEKAAAIAAGGAKETVVVTPLMEFVRQRRAAKATPQYVADNSMSILTQKEAKDAPAQILGSRREDQQRKDREVLNDRKKKELAEGKEKKAIRDAVNPSIFLAKNSASILRMDSGKDRSAGVSVKDSVDTNDPYLTANEGSAVDLDSSSSHGLVRGKAGANDGLSGDGAKDLNKREVLRRKQLLLSKDKVQKDNETGPGSPSLSSATGGSSYSQRHRPPVSPRVNSPGTPSQQGPSSFYNSMSGESNTPTGLSKSGHRRDLGRNSTRGGLSPREHTSSVQQSASSQLPSDPQTQSQQVSNQTERVGKRPPRPQSARATGKEQVFSSAFPSESDAGPSTTEEKISNASPKEAYSAGTGIDKQDSRRVRNKDRPDRPVWTPRRRSDTAQSSDPSSSWVPSDASASDNVAPDTPATAGSSIGVDTVFKPDKAERVPHRQAGKGATSAESGSGEGKTSVAYQGSGSVEGGRVQTGFGSAYNTGSGKVRYVESSTARSSRGGRPGGIVLSIQERTSPQVEQKVDASPTAGDSKTPTAQHHERENGEITPSSAIDKERRKLDSSPSWNEPSGGGHRSVGRRERALQQGSKDVDGAAAGPESSKPIKRSGSLSLGSNEPSELLNSEDVIDFRVPLSLRGKPKGDFATEVFDAPLAWWEKRSPVLSLSCRCKSTSVLDLQSFNSVTGNGPGKRWFTQENSGGTQRPKRQRMIEYHEMVVAFKDPNLDCTSRDKSQA
ncbi:hypothetical protein AXG93_620s1130 [Marchantia polymorpha subsp. ruderalis]|uniref:UPF3 domain-containing protein n=1 Tax=Marchantia polymorpha subsp. ruderalis TaxID=1480154 RepID=A0A176VTS4_MARPO|nr:hypothetical protein AXG93_620s1130 [Marchantia polymorpha subsp. ruderalis]